MLLASYLLLAATWVTAASSAVQLLDHHEVTRLGCFIDKAAHRDIPECREYKAKNSRQTCLSHCRSRAFLFAGLQAGSFCCCGNTYGMHGAASNSECDKKCVGGSNSSSSYGTDTVTCGGAFRNEVFNTGIYPPGSALNLEVNEVLRKHLHSMENKDDVQRFGCYQDKATPADLPHAAETSSLMSPSRCVTHCRAKAFKYAGLQAGDRCRCGNSYGRHGRLDDAMCHVPCSGDASVTCGAPLRNEIYSTGTFKTEPILPGSPDFVPGETDVTDSIIAIGKVSDPNGIKEVIKTNMRVQLLGCYKDFGTNKDKDLPVSVQHERLNSPYFCVNFCRSAAYRVAAVRSNGLCSCGHGIGAQTSVPEKQCNAPCPGDASISCGGVGAKQIFTTGLFTSGSSGGKAGGSGSDNAKSKWLADGRVYRLGCYKDTVKRDMPFLLRNRKGKVSPNFCVSLCRSLAYRVAGIQTKHFCTCGNSFGRYGKRSDSECSMPCMEISGLSCGGRWRNELFSTGIFPPGSRLSKALRSSTGKLSHQLAIHGRVQRVGCFVAVADLEGPPIGDLKLAAASQNSPQFCVGFCRSLAYKFAGLLGGSVCECYHAHPVGARVEDGVCGLKCNADNSVTCGGKAHSEVYSTGLYMGIGYVNRLDLHIGRLHEDNRVLRLGCFKATLANLNFILFDKQTTPQLCVGYCRSRGYRQAVLSEGLWCACANSADSRSSISSKLRDSECNVPCKAEARQSCGGTGDKVEIYTTGIYTEEKFKELYHGPMAKTLVNLRIGNTRKSVETFGRVQRIGCFVDKPSRKARDLVHYYKSGARTSPAFCIDYCRSRAFRFAGLRDGNTCGCGNSYGRYEKTQPANASECSMPCPGGDSGATCGGAMKNEIFSTGILPPGSVLLTIDSATLHGILKLEAFDGRVQRVGCYKENSACEGHDMSLQFTSYRRASPIYCIERCRAKGYRFAGLFNGNRCGCGNRYGSEGRSDDSKCNVACSGDASVTCGGVSSSEVYSTGILPPGSIPVHKSQAQLAKTLKEYELDGRVQRFGCYEDKKAQSDLPFVIESGDRASPQFCLNRCRSKAYKYFGLQLTLCFCGNSYGRQWRLKDSQCSVKCKGDASVTCGGDTMCEVYSTGLRNEAK